MKIIKSTPHLTTLKELGRRLVIARKQQRFTQAELARAAGLGVVTVIRIESGQDAQFSSWIKLFRVLGMTPSLDALLPEEILSPMFEARKQKVKKQKARKEKSGKQKSGNQNPQKQMGQEPHQQEKKGTSKKNIWGDGKS